MVKITPPTEYARRVVGYGALPLFCRHNMTQHHMARRNVKRAMAKIARRLRGAINAGYVGAFSRRYRVINVSQPLLWLVYEWR